MKRLLKISAAVIAVYVLVAALAVEVSAIAPSYTYSYDWWFEDRESPDAYVASESVSGSSLGTTNMKTPQSMFVIGDTVYVCDTGNNRVLQLEYNAAEDKYLLEREIKAVMNNGTEEALKEPQDIFVKESGEIYICDTGNQRVVHLDSDLNVLSLVTKPKDNTIDEKADFLPSKLVVDRADRVYIQARNVNKGLMEFDSEGEFAGYMGASKVKVSVGEYLWKYLATDAQKSAMEQFVPTEYNNLCLDEKGFIYVTTAVFEESELRQDLATPVRKLNAMGTDILIKNGYNFPIGDLHWANAGGISGSSRFVDVTVTENDTYYCLDRTRGRIFAYDFQGNMLYAFGGIGNKLGYFQYPSSIEMRGDELLVLDYRLGTFTRFKLTDFGRYINDGLTLYKQGKYDESAESWKKVLQYNGNYDFAYIGIGRSLLRQGDYEGAMEYFELKMDDDNYSKAYQHYRKQWFEDRMNVIVPLVLAVIILPMIVSGIKNIKRRGPRI